MTKKELIERLKEFPDDYEVYVKPNRRIHYKSEWRLPRVTTNIVVERSDYDKRIYLN